ncbi:MAG: cell division ATP-binding protein FtsE [Peptostreptococcaceae bacterium]|nr:cell division ATP-binding protein FtsE [Peptostreptococcaceae bacterium]
MIKIINLSKTYGNGVKALSDVSLHIDIGEFVFVVGPSGAGKSTFVKVLLMEEEPTVGKIIIANQNITNLHRRQVPYLRRKIGVVFQDFRLLPTKTVYENVAFSMEIIGATPREIRRRVPTVLSMVGLSKKANMHPDELSGGEKQRVSVARAVINNPPILIADEPTGNLDPETSWEIMKLLSYINRRGTTVIMATHAKDIVDTMKKRVIALENGMIVRDEIRGGYGYED